MKTHYSDLLFNLALVNRCFIVNLVKFNLSYVLKLPSVDLTRADFQKAPESANKT